MSQEKIERWNEVDGNLDNGEKLQAFWTVPRMRMRFCSCAVQMKPFMNALNPMKP